MEDGLQINRLLQSAAIQVRDGGLAKEDVSGDGKKRRHSIVLKTDSQNLLIG